MFRTSDLILLYSFIPVSTPGDCLSKNKIQRIILKYKLLPIFPKLEYSLAVYTTLVLDRSYILNVNQGHFSLIGQV